MPTETRKKIDAMLDTISMYLYPKDKEDEVVKKLQEIYQNLRQKFEHGDYDENYFAFELVLNNFMNLLEGDYITKERIEKLESEVYFSQLQIISKERIPYRISMNNAFYTKKLENYTLSLKELGNMTINEAVRTVLSIKTDYLKKDGIKSDVFEGELAEGAYQIVMNMFQEDMEEEVLEFISRFNMDSDLAKVLQRKMGEIILTKANQIKYQDMEYLMKYVTLKEKINVKDIFLWKQLFLIENGKKKKQSVNHLEKGRSAEQINIVRPKVGLLERLFDSSSGQTVERQIQTKKQHSMESNVTLLRKEECFGTNKNIIFHHMGLKAAMTDYALLLGGESSSGTMYDSNGNRTQAPIGLYWTKTQIGRETVCAIDDTGYTRTFYTGKRNVGIRPVIRYLSERRITRNKECPESRCDRFGTIEIEHGFYPQKAATATLQMILEDAYQQGNIKVTGLIYTQDAISATDSTQKFVPQRNIEYVYEGKYYVRVQARFASPYQLLSNGIAYKAGEFVWVEVLPVEWLIPCETGTSHMMLSKKILFSGIQFKYRGNYRENFFEETDIKYYLDFYFTPEIEQGMDR